MKRARPPTVVIAGFTGLPYLLVFIPDPNWPFFSLRVVEVRP